MVGQMHYTVCEIVPMEERATIFVQSVDIFTKF